MRLASFNIEGREGYGYLEGNDVLELTTREFPSLRSLLTSGTPLTAAALGPRVNGRVPREALTWRAPIPDPDKILGVGLNYRGHAQEAKLPIPERPSIFARWPGSVVGHLEAAIAPAVSVQYDFEAELAVVIGRSARNVRIEQAMDIVAGYSCFADHSVRDWQRHASQITPGKNFERSGGFGPWIVSRDEIPEPMTLEVIGRLNGREVQRDSVAGMIFTLPALIAYISTFVRLLPGDVIATGTPAGVGFARTPPLWMRPGDVFAVEIPGIGTLENPITQELTA